MCFFGVLFFFGVCVVFGMFFFSFFFVCVLFCVLLSHSLTLSLSHSLTFSLLLFFDLLLDRFFCFTFVFLHFSFLHFTITCVSCCSFAFLHDFLFACPHRVSAPCSTALHVSFLPQVCKNRLASVLPTLCLSLLERSRRCRMVLLETASSAY